MCFAFSFHPPTFEFNDISNRRLIWSVTFFLQFLGRKEEINSRLCFFVIKKLLWLFLHNSNFFPLRIAKCKLRLQEKKVANFWVYILQLNFFCFFFCVNFLFGFLWFIITIKIIISLLSLRVRISCKYFKSTSCFVTFSVLTYL